jgi:hypothetical protein
VRPDEKVLLREGLSRAIGQGEGDTIYRKIVARVGEEPVTVLGYGEQGVVYGLPSGKVLKVTSDEGELLAMNLLKGRRHPNLVQVFDVFRIALRDPLMTVGVILREAVDGSIATAGIYRDLDRLLLTAVIQANQLYNVRVKKVPPRQALWEAMTFFSQEIETRAEEDLKPWEQELLPGIAAAIEELHRLGIYMLDFKSTNFGLIDGKPALFDLSIASVPEDAPALELGRRRPGSGVP